jgi:hypothetical protein
MIAIIVFCPFYRQPGPEKLLRRDDVTRIVRCPPVGRQANPVETPRNIAFANALNHPPKSPLRDNLTNSRRMKSREHEFQEEGTAND